MFVDYVADTVSYVGPAGAYLIIMMSVTLGITVLASSFVLRLALTMNSLKCLPSSTALIVASLPVDKVCSCLFFSVRSLLPSRLATLSDRSC